jgi:N-acetylmuramoyl-L-alanine amidase
MTKRIKALLAAVILLGTLLTFTAPSNQVFAATQATVKASSLNVRESPTTSSKSIGSFKKGQTVTIIQQQKGWSKVPYGKKTGWVSSTYVTLIQAKPVVKTAVKPVVQTPVKYYVTATSLNIRKGPSTSLGLIESIKKNAAVSLYEKKGTWARVKTASGKTGWASTQYLTTKAPSQSVPKPVPSKVPAPVTSGKAYVVIRQNGTNIRKTPSTSAGIVATVSKGTTLEKISVDNGWVQVKTKSGEKGYIANWLATTAGKGVSGKVIVLDPGHGGVDTGAVGKNHYEREINLTTANELKTILQNAGAKVIMTRTSNTSRKLELSERVAISHKYKPDVFISIHYNSGGNATGIDTFYDTKYGNEKELAESIQSEVIKATQMKSRGIKPAEFYVVKYNEMPSVLVELGFISNPAEEKKIATREYQQKAARGIFNGLNKYFNL